ncbi:uncharacterized protein B0H64DRAFT_438757 [Chaetomium fimeti]|uniref:Uncharacterized protein n=1 Tax=Chaetomium fimeti TaxID=1854472 RepID=A0AAE0HKK6_9PEZI|nr:hypothetical protein B0H64DRAFT_438757 [Chaetomium fimeti]
MPMDSYHAFQVRTPEGGVVQDGDGHGTAVDATDERTPSSFNFSFTFVGVMILVLYFTAMFFLGLLCYSHRALRRPRHEQQDGCCSVLWKAIKFAFFIRFLEICWEVCCSNGRGSGRSVAAAAAAAAGSGSSRRARNPADEEWYYGGSPYPSPYYNLWYNSPEEAAQPVPLRTMQGPTRRNTPQGSPEDGDMSAPARTWSGSTLDQSDAAVPAHPPRARLPRTVSEASTLRDA